MTTRKNAVLKIALALGTMRHANAPLQALADGAEHLVAAPATSH